MSCILFGLGMFYAGIETKGLGQQLNNDPEFSVYNGKWVYDITSQGQCPMMQLTVLTIEHYDRTKQETVMNRGSS